MLQLVPTERFRIYRETEILEWAIQRGILGPNGTGTLAKQHEKTLEEAREIGEGITEGNKEKAKDGIGDTFVTLCILADMLNLTMQECIDHAYNEIKDRTGRMVDGVFVKDEA